MRVTTKTDSKLPDGHIRARFEIAIEGPAEQVAQQIAETLKSFPPPERKKAAREITKKLREKSRQIRSK